MTHRAAPTQVQREQRKQSLLLASRLARSQALIALGELGGRADAVADGIARVRPPGVGLGQRGGCVLAHRPAGPDAGRGHAEMDLAGLACLALSRPCAGGLSRGGRVEKEPPQLKPWIGADMRPALAATVGRPGAVQSQRQQRPCHGGEQRRQHGGRRATGHPQRLSAPRPPWPA